MALVTGIIGAPFGEVTCRLGLIETMLCLFKRPDLLKKLSELVLRRYIEEAKALIEAGVEAFWIEEVFAGTDTISPRNFEDIALPYEKRLINELNTLGAYTILYFCGNPMPIIEKIASVNAHAFAFEEDKKGFRINISQIRNLLKGRACLFGNFDAINTLRKNPREVEESAKEMILKLAPEGGFVLGTGSPVLKDVPPENVDALIIAARNMSRELFVCRK
ncbi:MAG: uroporphyrinogen decarboxylase family protein [Candidatus Bathyarchaeia archaeon]